MSFIRMLAGTVAALLLGAGLGARADETDKTGEDGEQFLRAFNWDGKELTLAFEVDFLREKLGRAHHMKLGSKALKLAFQDAR